MLPLSFKEYVKVLETGTNWHENIPNTSATVRFPTLELKDNVFVNDYLSGIYNTIVLKDIVTRKKISDAMMLESVIQFALII